MPDSSPATKASVEAAAAALSGCRLRKITYFGLSGYGDDDYDCGRYHDATMGVELTTAAGDVFFACWGDAFGHFGLELFNRPARDVIHVDNDWRDFSAHRWWAPITHSKGSAEILWRTGYADKQDADDDRPAPLALVLTSGRQQIWIVAAEERDDEVETPPAGFWLGADAVLVTGDPEFAAWLGL